MSDPSDEEGKGGPMAKIRRLGERLIHSKHMMWGIGLASFLEAIIVPIPLETILIPLMQARRKQLFTISTIVLAACLVAAAFGYFVGRFVFDAVGPQIIDFVSSPEQFEEVKQRMEEQGFWFVFSVGVVPVPFQIAMLAAGATGYSFFSFMFASALARAIRYYGLAVLVYFAGNKAQELYERHKTVASVVLLVLILGAWAYALFG